MQRFRSLRPPRPRPSTVLIGVGVTVLLVGAFVSLAPWYEAIQWRSSSEALRAQRNAEVAQVVRVTPAPARPGGAPAPDAGNASVGLPDAGNASARPPDAGDTSAGLPNPGETSSRRPLSTPPQPAGPPQQSLPAASQRPAATPGLGAFPGLGEPPGVPPQPTLEQPTPTLGPSDLQLAASGFAFLDPPEPGARARLTLSVRNPTDQPGGPIALALPQTWLLGYRLESVDPPPVDESGLRGVVSDGALRLTFDGPPAESALDLTVDVVTTDEVIDAPLLTVFDAQGREVGHTQPPTEAPPPRPGPIYSLDIPHLKLHAGVLPVDWEPPLFVLGQLRASAYVSQGNSVLVGHVRGAPGYNVFDRLDQLNLGDRISASSRGETYDFVVSQTQVLPEDDISPTQSTSTPRLTLMTCTGEWNPLTRDYADRLWVIAEPPDIAAATLAARQTPPTPVATAPPIVPAQISAPGGLGNTDANLAAAWRVPVGESPTGLAVYHAGGSASVTEYRALLADPPVGAGRALLVARVMPSASPIAFEAAVGVSRALLPKDAQPRSDGPEGNQHFVVERFTSPSLASALPAKWFADRQGQPGDFVVVYAKRADGRIPLVAVGIGDDAESLLGWFADVPVDR